MPKSKKPVAKYNKTISTKTKVVKKNLASDYFSQIQPIALSTINKARGYKYSKQLALVALAVGAGALIYLNRGLFLAATVNGQPITSLELSQRLHDQYKSPVLRQMIEEKLIAQEAAKRGVTISEVEVNAKLDELEKTYGGKETFAMLLSQQGLDRQTLGKNIKIRLLIEKMYSSEIQASEDEIKQFIEQNKDLPEATDTAKIRQIAEGSIKEQKLEKVFAEKFQEIQSQSKIQTF